MEFIRAGNRGFRWGNTRTFKLVALNIGTNVERISSIAAGWKNLRTLSAIYPMYQDV